MLKGGPGGPNYMLKDGPGGPNYMLKDGPGGPNYMLKGGPGGPNSLSICFYPAVIIHWMKYINYNNRMRWSVKVKIIPT